VRLVEFLLEHRVAAQRGGQLGLDLGELFLRVVGTGVARSGRGGRGGGGLGRELGLGRGERATAFRGDIFQLLVFHGERAGGGPRFVKFVFNAGEVGAKFFGVAGGLAGGRGWRGVLGSGDLGAALLEPAVALGELLGRHLVGERLQLFAGGAAFGGEAEPHKGFDAVGVGLLGVGVSEAEVVLGDAIALLRLGAEGGKVVRIGGKSGDGEAEENRQDVMELGRGMRHGGKAV
jgi:hypothetical protein